MSGMEGWGAFSEDTPSGFVFIDSVGYLEIRHFLGDMLCREDTLSKKVFVKRRAIDSAESLLYDFSLNVGDTLKTLYTRYYVDNISTVLVGGVAHKTWSFTACWKDSSIAHLYLREYSVIEGIGSTKGPFFPFFPSLFESSSNLYCFRQSGTAPSVSDKVEEFNNSSCGRINRVESTHYYSNKVNILPNPIERNSILTFPNGIANATLFVVNSIGAVICKEAIFSTNSYPIGEAVKSSGVYFYTLMNNESGAIYKGTFVKE